MTSFTSFSGSTRRLRLPPGRPLFQLLTGAGVVLTALALTACDHSECIANGDAPDIAGYRNPETGLCEGVGPGGGGVDCGGFGTPETGADRALPDEALCFGSCEGLDEQTCLATAACRGIYVGDQYLDCWGTAPSGPDPSLTCDGLDAWTCSRTDHCSAVHAGDGAGGAGSFVSCRDEKVGCYSNEECGGGSCTADTECLSPPGGSELDVCYGFCEGNPPGGPGSCVGDIVCDQPPPDCPDGTLPGRGSGCWTGYCIPLDRCDSLPACAELGEADCVSRSDCTASYRGQDCSCDDTGCTCATYVFESCGA